MLNVPFHLVLYVISQKYQYHFLILMLVLKYILYVQIQCAIIPKLTYAHIYSGNFEKN